MNDKAKRFFDEHIVQIVKDGDWEFGDGEPMTEYAIEFIHYFQQTERKLQNEHPENLPFMRRTTS